MFLLVGGIALLLLCMALGIVLADMNDRDEGPKDADNWRY